MTRRSVLLLATASATLLLAGCASAAGSPSSGSTTATADPLTGTVTVLAAASLTESFETLAASFHTAHPGVTVTFDLGGSSALATQITQGAPADVFASANQSTMKTVSDAKLTDGAPTLFATNVLTLVVPPGNPAHITSLTDLTRPGVKSALCDTTVPCGVAAQQLFTAEGLRVTPVTLEQDVKAVLTKFELDEVDAGLVYVTDAKSAEGKVDTVAVPAAAKVVNDYPIALLKNATDKKAAAAFIAYVLSAPGQKVLHDAGFGHR